MGSPPARLSSVPRRECDQRTATAAIPVASRQCNGSYGSNCECFQVQLPHEAGDRSYVQSIFVLSKFLCQNFKNWEDELVREIKREATGNPKLNPFCRQLRPELKLGSMNSPPFSEAPSTVTNRPNSSASVEEEGNVRRKLLTFVARGGKMKVCLPEVLRPRPDGMTFNHQAPKSASQRYLAADDADRSLSGCC